VTVPNWLTLARLVVAPVLVVLLATGRTACLDVAFALFVLAGLTDVLDGALARKLRQASDLGRCMDPVVDKILMCAVLIVLVGMDVGLPGWLVAVVVGRELFVSGLRSYLESKGIDYGNFWWLGKQKIVIQFLTVCTLCLYAAHFRGVRWAEVLTQVLVYVMLLSVLLSGVLHIGNAKRVFRSQ